MQLLHALRRRAVLFAGTACVALATSCGSVGGSLDPLTDAEIEAVLTIFFQENIYSQFFNAAVRPVANRESFAVQEMFLDDACQSGSVTLVVNSVMPVPFTPTAPTFDPNIPLVFNVTTTQVDCVDTQIGTGDEPTHGRSVNGTVTLDGSGFDNGMGSAGEGPAEQDGTGTISIDLDVAWAGDRARLTFGATSTCTFSQLGDITQPGQWEFQNRMEARDDRSHAYGQLTCGSVTVECETRDLTMSQPPLRSLFNACQFP